MAIGGNAALEPFKPDPADFQTLGFHRPVWGMMGEGNPSISAHFCLPTFKFVKYYFTKERPF